MTAAFRIEALGESLVPAFRGLFAEAEIACHCRYWHFSGTKNDWLARCATNPETNADEHEAAVRSGSEESRGLLAFEGDRAVGWLKLTPRSAVPKLRNLPVYRRLPLGEDAGVYSVGCMLVLPSHRHRGVGRALLLKAEAQVLAWGGHTLEAYPRSSSESLRDDEVWMGPAALFLDLGYLHVAGEAPYPVLRKKL